MLLVKPGEKLPTYETIKTPSFGLNYITGGGLWTGRFHLIWGNPAAGKSTMALHVAAEAQKMGYTPVIVDAENAMTEEWVERCGVDPSNRYIIQSTSAEEILKTILPFFREKESKYIFLIDSINNIYLDSAFKNDDAGMQIGIGARSQGHLITKINNLLTGTVNKIVIMVAQQTIGSKGQYFVVQGKYGNVVHHNMSNIIRLTAGSSADDTERDDDGRIVDRKVTWVIEKSRQRTIEGARGDYWFNPSTASISMPKEAAHIAVRNGIIEKKGAWYYFNDEKYQGINSLVAGIEEAGMIDDIYKALDGIDLGFDYESTDPK